jgi:hypothetical protein
MVASFLWWKLCAGLVLDEASECGLLALEFATLVRPGQDTLLIFLETHVSQRPGCQDILIHG